MDIELYKGTTKAIISTKGGYVTNLADDNGDILFPKRVLMDADGNEKIRGGCHVCLPNFGPGGASGLDQHGYGRTSEWHVVDRSETRVELMCEGVGAYASMDSFLTYEVYESAFTMSLRLKNKGTSPLKVAPAFHPYWYRGGEMPKVNETQYEDLAEFTEAKFIDGHTQHLRVAGRDLLLQSDELTAWVQWTDRLGDYFCLEPSQSGFAFTEDILRANRLEPGGEAMYTFVVAW